MKFWEFKAAANGKDHELMVYGDIAEWWGVDSKEFNTQLNAIEADNINVRINSYGGEVFTAQAIYSGLRRHKAHITVYIDGIAASAASLIAMAGDTVVMPANSMMMIHNPLTWMGGNANDMREMADVLDKIRDSIVSAYQAKTGMEPEAIIELLDAETWLTAQEAVDYGFADQLDPAMQVAASANRDTITVNGLKANFSRYLNAEKMIGMIPEKPSNTTGDSAGDKTEDRKEKKPMNLEQLKAEHPDLYNSVLAAGEQAGLEKERARIKAIEEMAMKGHEALITKAKFETGITAEAMAMEIIKAEKAKGGKFLNDRAADAAEIGDASDSGANDGLETQQTADGKNDEAELKAFADAAVKSFNARAGHKTIK